MSRLRILVADDHEVFRRGVRTLLEARPEWKICGEAATGREAIEKAKKLKPDIVMLDISMPDLNGLEAAREILKAHPQARILVFTIHDSGYMATEVLAAGIRGLVLKSDAASDLLQAVEAIAQDKSFLSPRATGLILSGQVRSGDPGRLARSLTPREKEILRLLAQGKSGKEVAATLNISPKTVNTHRTNLMSKLNLHSLSDLVYFAIRNKIVQV
jgi:DNA-binding NarL/FixJ family response regulator